MSIAAETIEQLHSWASARDDVHALVLLGSQARTDHPADDSSDIDVVLAVDDPTTYLADDDWLHSFGAVMASFVDATPVGGMSERRVLFASGQDVDFTFVPVEMMRLLPEFAEDPDVRGMFGRGVRILIGDDALRAGIARIVPPLPGDPAPVDSDLGAVSNRFWFKLVWAAKKWRRGELWVAMTTCETVLTTCLVDMLRSRTSLRDPTRDLWHGNRYLEEWLEPDVVEALAATRGGYGRDAIATSLRRVAAMFTDVESECRALTDFSNGADDDGSRRLFERLLAT
ncbi:MAG: aminoglycoside 6-adenylyltransferase [Acidimicrobiia bacterium]